MVDLQKTFNGDGQGVAKPLKNHRWQWCPGKKTLPSHCLKKMTIVEVYHHHWHHHHHCLLCSPTLLSSLRHQCHNVYHCCPNHHHHLHHCPHYQYHTDYHPCHHYHQDHRYLEDRCYVRLLALMKVRQTWSLFAR